MCFLPNLMVILNLDSIVFKCRWFVLSMSLVPCSVYILQFFNVSALIQIFFFIFWFFVGHFSFIIYFFLWFTFWLARIHLQIMFIEKIPNILDSELQHLENLYFVFTYDLQLAAHQNLGLQLFSLQTL